MYATCRSKDTLSFPSDAMSPETITVKNEV